MSLISIRLMNNEMNYMFDGLIFIFIGVWFIVLMVKLFFLWILDLGIIFFGIWWDYFDKMMNGLGCNDRSCSCRYILL